MNLFNWDDDLSVGIKELDEHHQKLIELVNKLHGMMKIGKGREVIEKVLQRLFDYAKVHFSIEESYMQKANFPYLEQHKQEHSKLVNKLNKFDNDMKQGKATLTIELLNFLKDWLSDHIKKSDKKYSSFLSNN